MHDHDDPRAEEALLAREQDRREEGRWADSYRTRVREPDLVLDTDENGEPRGTVPDPDRAAVLALVETLDRPMALLPAAEMAVAALDRVVDILRAQRLAGATTVRALSEAHGAAELAGIAFGKLRLALADALERAASRFPKECMACGAVCADTPEWQALPFIGVQVGNPDGPDLELRLCGCGSTIAMPRVGA